MRSADRSVWRILSDAAIVGAIIAFTVSIPHCQPLSPVHVFNGVPTGSCQPSQLAVDSTTSGSLYTCFNGAWVASSGGGGSPIAANSIPVSNGTTYQASTLVQDPSTGQIVPSAGMGSLTDTVAFAAGAPVFDFSLGNAFFLTLTGAATATTLNTAYPQFIFTRICQDSTGGWAFTWPAGFGEAPTVNTTASVCTAQYFYWDGTNARAAGPAFFTGTPTLIIGTARTAPATPATGQVALWSDSTSKSWEGKGDGGVITGMAAARTAVSNQFISAFDPTAAAASQWSTRAIVTADLPSNQIIKSIAVNFTGGPSFTTTTICGWLPYAATVTGATLLSDSAGAAGSSNTVDFKSVAYASYTGPASATTEITGTGTIPALGTGVKYQDTTLTNWAPTISAGTVICGVLTNGSNATWITAVLRVNVQ